MGDRSVVTALLTEDSYHEFPCDGTIQLKAFSGIICPGCGAGQGWLDGLSLWKHFLSPGKAQTPPQATDPVPSPGHFSQGTYQGCQL